METAITILATGMIILFITVLPPFFLSPVQEYIFAQHIMFFGAIVGIWIIHAKMIRDTGYKIIISHKKLIFFFGGIFLFLVFSLIISGKSLLGIYGYIQQDQAEVEQWIEWRSR